MTETFFAINDLLRRKLQTALVVVSLTMCVASTLFLLLLGDKIGLGLLSMAENRLTVSLSTVFSRFIMFIGFLIFVVGVVIISFMVFVMMSQRVRDIGLMRAVGCPSDLVFGYFMNELVIVTVLGCLFGVILGLVLDYASTSFLNSIGLQTMQASINFWLALMIFVLFFVLSLIIGAKPILDTTKVEPARALSPSFSLGLKKESDFKGVSRAGIIIKMAVRTLFRRKSPSFRIILCLTAVFILLTVSVAGGIIAHQTTRSWIEGAIGRDIILIAHRDMCNQYTLLLSRFYEPQESTQFNYTADRYLVSEELINELKSVANISIETRLIMETRIEEIQGIIFGSNTAETTYVGDNRKGTSLVIGVDPGKVLGRWFVDGEFLNDNQASNAVVGDTVARKMFTSPIDQSVKVFGIDLHITAVCVDPINNGNVTYVPLKVLQNISNVTKPNLVMAKIDDSTNRTKTLEQVRASVAALNPEFEVFELNAVLDRALGFLSYVWSAITLLPILSLSAATICLIAYVVLTINEQRQEFGILRAIGAKPRTVVKIVATQSLLVLLSSCVTGIALGVIATLLILIPEPLVTSYTVLEIAAWLLAALALTFLFSILPAWRFSRRPILETMAPP